MTLAAVILAGGQGERLGGVIKARLRLNGAPLLDHVRGVLPPEALLLVSTGHFPPEAIGIPPGAQAVPDLDSAYAGPMAGFAAAVAHCRDLPNPPGLLLTVSVDTPFLPAGLFAGLSRALGQGDCAVIRQDGQLHPTISLWRLPALAGLPEEIRAGTAPRSLKRLCEQHDAAILDWVSAPDADPFAGINTLADLLAAQRRARSVETLAP